MCREGGCGCCVVAVTRQDLSTSKVATMAVNSVSEATFAFFFFFNKITLHIMPFLAQALRKTTFEQIFRNDVY